LFVPQSGGIDNRSGFLPDGLVKKKKRLFLEALFFVRILPEQAKAVVFWLFRCAPRLPAKKYISSVA